MLNIVALSNPLTFEHEAGKFAYICIRGPKIFGNIVGKEFR